MHQLCVKLSHRVLSVWGIGIIFTVLPHSINYIIFIYEIDIDKKVRQMKLLLYGYIMTVKKYSPIQSGYWKPNAIVLKLSIIFFAISCPNM